LRKYSLKCRAYLHTIKDSRYSVGRRCAPVTVLAEKLYDAAAEEVQSPLWHAETRRMPEKTFH